MITVLAGRPPAYPDEVTDWDAAGGFRPGDDVVAVRQAEDRAAMASMEATPCGSTSPTTSTWPPRTDRHPSEVAPALEEAIVGGSTRARSSSPWAWPTPIMC